MTFQKIRAATAIIAIINKKEEGKNDKSMINS